MAGNASKAGMHLWLEFRECLCARCALDSSHSSILKMHAAVGLQVWIAWKCCCGSSLAYVYVQDVLQTWATAAFRSGMWIECKCYCGLNFVHVCVQDVPQTRATAAFWSGMLRWICKINVAVAQVSCIFMCRRRVAQHSGVVSLLSRNTHILYRYMYKILRKRRVWECADRGAGLGRGWGGLCASLHPLRGIILHA